MKHLQPSQIEALVKAANETVRTTAPDRERLVERNRLLFLMCYEHGLRISECLSLTRAHVRRGYLSIKGKKKGKRADEKMNPSTLALWEKVTATLAPHTLIFPISRQFASELFHRGCDAAGIQLQLRQGVHSLRHSLAHHLLDAGAPLPVVQKSLRHRSIGSTGVYLEADGASVDEWRAKATMGGTYVAAQRPVSLAEIQRKSRGSLNSRPRCRARRSRPTRRRCNDAQADRRGKGTGRRGLMQDGLDRMEFIQKLAAEYMKLAAHPAICGFCRERWTAGRTARTAGRCRWRRKPASGAASGEM